MQMEGNYILRFYRVLEVSQESTLGEVKKAYRRKCLQCFPDQEKHQSYLDQITEAFEGIVSFRGSQDGYDEVRKEDTKEGMRYEDLSLPLKFESSLKPQNNSNLLNSSSFDSYPQFSSSQYNRLTSSYHYGYEETVEGKSRDLVITAFIDLEDLYTGVLKDIHFMRYKERADFDVSNAQICTKCNGSGSNSICVADFTNSDKYECNTCNGSGYLDSVSQESSWVKLFIEKGTLSRVDPFRFINQGYQYPFKSQGDLVIQVAIRNHKIFKRDESNLVMNKTVDDSTSKLDFTIRHLNGELLRIKSPIDFDISKHSSVEVRYKGLPIPYREDFGNLIIKLIDEPDEIEDLTYQIESEDIEELFVSPITKPKSLFSF